MNRVIILGADGYLGWPTAMHLSANGWEVIAVDNYFKRRLALEYDAEPLYRVPNLVERCSLWRASSDFNIIPLIYDLTQRDLVEKMFRTYPPDAVIHFAEQPSAPFSMKNRTTGMLTLQNNLSTTLNLIYGVRQFTPNAHIIKLGSMGEYGTPNIDIEEGWLNVKHKDRSHTFLYPREPGSLYHVTKVMDTDLLYFFTKIWHLRVTDLMQGPVYGIETYENENARSLYPSFHYDELFGTVLNRFIVQAVMKHPLTVYGLGGQTRGFINIKDTVQAIALELEYPPKSGELRIINQITEVFSVLELAQKIAKLFSVEIDHNHENPRIEAEWHHYNPTYTVLDEIGLKPHLLTSEVLMKMFEIVEDYKDRIRPDLIYRGVKWKKKQEPSS